jgi:hypothetical protein
MADFSSLRLRLEPASQEQAYREAVLPRNARALRAILLLAVVFQLANTPNDRAVVPDQADFLLVMGSRLVGAAVSLLALTLVREDMSPRRLDQVGTAWGVITAITVIVSAAGLPSDYLAYAAWNTVLVLAMYVVLPTPIHLQAMVAAVYTVGEVFIQAYFRNFAGRIVFDILLAHACGHMIGLVASWQMQRTRRDEFLAHAREREAHHKEQQAWRELKMLQGILPICSNCHKIRTDAGEWAQLEVYVQNHSEAQFSHGICPECAARYYGDR